MLNVQLISMRLGFWKHIKQRMMVYSYSEYYHIIFKTPCLEELRVEMLNSFYTPTPVKKLQPSSVIHLHDDNDHVRRYITLESSVEAL